MIQLRAVQVKGIDMLRNSNDNLEYLTVWTNFKEHLLEKSIPETLAPRLWMRESFLDK